MGFHIPPSFDGTTNYRPLLDLNDNIGSKSSRWKRRRKRKWKQSRKRPEMPGQMGALTWALA